MLPSGHSTPMGGAQPVPSSLLRSNSGMLGGQGGSVPSPGTFPSLMSPRPHYNNMNLLGNVPNVSSLLNQSFGNGVLNPGLSGANGQRGAMDTGAEPDPLSGSGMGFNPSPSSFGPSSIANAASSNQVQGQQFSEQAGNQMLGDRQQSHPQQVESQNFQHPQQPMHQFAASNQPQQSQQFQSVRGGLGGIGQVKLESQISNDQHGPQQQQQVQSLRGMGPVKLEPQQLQSMRSQPNVKIESPHSEQSMLLHQQQQQQHQQQQLLQSRQSSQAAASAQLNLLQQHRLIQLQQQQQQHQHQLLKALPQQQRSQIQQQFQSQNLPLRSPVKPVYEAGACARRITQYMHQQQTRPEDNNIEFWRKFVSDFFAPNSKKKWCVSMYGSGRQTTGVFPQDVWHCEICKRKPGRGFEATAEVLPRLFKIKYESGTLEELLYVDMPHEYPNSSGQIVLDYAKAIQESVFEQLRVVRDGRLRIVFSTDLKICSWEFCAIRHEELIPRRLLIPQVSQLGTAAQKYQAASQNSSNSSVSDLQSNCNMFVSSARQLAKALEVPLVNDLGYTKRYVRCLQISEVVNSMKDLIDYSRVTGAGPMESLAKFPRRSNGSSGIQIQNQPSEDQQQQSQLQHPHPGQTLQRQQQSLSQQQHMMQSPNNEQASSSQAAHGLPGVNTSLNPSSTSTSAAHKNPMVSRPPNPMNSTGSPYATTSMPSPGSTGTMQPPPPLQTSHSPFQSPTPAVSANSPLNQPSNNALSNSAGHANTANSPATTPIQQQQHQSAILSDGDPTDSQSSVQKIIQEVMLSGQMNGPGGMGVSSFGNDMRNVNGVHPSNNSNLNGPNGLVVNGLAHNNPSMMGFGGMGNGMGQSAVLNGVRAAMGGNPITMNGRVGMASMGRDQGAAQSQQQDLSNQLLNGFGSVNGFNNLQFDWKPSPSGG